MATNRLPETEQSENVGALVKGIVQDLERLAQQHIELFKKDLRDDLHKMERGGISLGIGLGVCLIGGMLLGICFSELILRLFPDPALWRWAAYGIMGILITGFGGAMLYLGQREVKEATQVAEKTIEALEDDVKWMSKPNQPK
jgi:hypothetical protein